MATVARGVLYVMPPLEPSAPPWTPSLVPSSPPPPLTPVSNTPGGRQQLQNDKAALCQQQQQQSNGSHASFAMDDEPEPSAPPLELMDKVDGYEQASFDAVDVPPPYTPSTPKEEDTPKRAPLPCTPQVTEQEARQALTKHVAKHCCYGKACARDMAITKIDHTSAFHYTLETFTEKRQTAWCFEPYTGGPVDGPSAGPAPGPWEVPVPSPTPFQCQTTSVEVPHTASVKTCHTCGGVGRKRCATCNGNGYEHCSYCQGDGQKRSLSGDNDRCFQCHGMGRMRCWKCNGDGVAPCRACSGTGQIKCYIKLTVVWSTKTDDHVVEHSFVPDDQIKFVSGQLVFEEQNSRIWPINHFPDMTVNMASVQLVQKHAAAFKSEKILMQRQRVRVIPVSTVYYEWRSHVGTFSVFGHEKKAYAPDYPQSCCCGCTIL
ncbi:protein SSUH2 homolog isoform X1 [Dermacentor andersoni]|uniref:protein SSUH2 homolog isoform X1 n=1 Tax=Dermacentor andersoni TaxID=34620 RepID=UPI0021556CC0|nr:protein SSUH2 homolog isoform X1 [Dermacentor andersoni]